MPTHRTTSRKIETFALTHPRDIKYTLFSFPLSVILNRIALLAALPVFRFLLFHILQDRTVFERHPMTARTKLLPGKKGTKSLVAKYGDALLCVRYRYDEKSRTRLKTVELIIERTPWVPALERLVPVRIGYSDMIMRERAKAAGGKWNPAEKVWYIEYGKIKGTELEKFMILETPAHRPGL